MRVKIYSNEHNAWWNYIYLGYTTNESEAGIFEIEEVNKKYPYIDFDTTKEDYLVKFECLTYEELLKENQELKDTNTKYAKLIDDFQTKNMRLEKAIKKAIELLSIDGKGTKKQVLNLLKEVLEE